MSKKTIGFIRYRSVQTAFKARRFARDQKRDLNTFVTLNFSDLGVDEEHADQFFLRLKKKASGWYANRRNKTATAFEDMGPFDWVYALENPRGSTHVHWFLRVPHGHQGGFDDMLVNRLRKMTGRKDLGSALHIQSVTRQGANGLMKYMLKGITPADAARFGIKPSDQGLVSGRRVQTSRSLGPAERERSGWQKANPGRRRWVA